MTTEARIDRRSFIKVTGAAAAAASTGLAGILASGRAPAYAQGTKLHMVRWNDFIPECRRRAEAAGAGGRQGARRRGHLRDHQRQRPPAAHHRRASSRAPAPTSSCSQQLAAPLRRTRLVDVSDVAERARQGRRAASTTSHALGCKVGGKWLAAAALASSACRRLPQVVVRRGRRQRVPEDLGRVARGRRQEAEGEGQADRPDARPHVRRRADVRLSRCCGRSAAPRSTPRARRSSSTRKGAVDSVKFMQALLEGRLRRGRPRLGRHQQQPRLPRRRDLRHAQRRLDLHRGQAPEGQDQGRQGRADEPDILHARSCRPGPAGQSRLSTPRPHVHHEVLEEPEARQGLPEAGCTSKENYEKWFDRARGLQRRRDQGVGEPPDVGDDGQPVRCFRTAARQTPDPRATPGRPPAKAAEAFTKYIVIGHVRQGHPGHEGRGRREVGRGRAEEDLRGLTAIAALRRIPIAVNRPIAADGRPAGRLALPHVRRVPARRAMTRLARERAPARLRCCSRRPWSCSALFIAYPFVRASGCR